MGLEVAWRCRLVGALMGLAINRGGRANSSRINASECGLEVAQEPNERGEQQQQAEWRLCLPPPLARSFNLRLALVARACAPARSTPLNSSANLRRRLLLPARVVGAPDSAPDAHRSASSSRPPVAGSCALCFVEPADGRSSSLAARRQPAFPVQMQMHLSGRVEAVSLARSRRSLPVRRSSDDRSERFSCAPPPSTWPINSARSE